MELKRPSTRLLAVQRIRLSLLAIIPAFFSACFVSHIGWVWWSLTLLWVLVYFYFYIFFFPIQLHKLAYSCNKSALILHSGVIYTRVKAIPFASLQYVLTFSTPLDRLFGVRNLVFFCAGSLNWQPGLLPEETEALQSFLEDEISEETR